MKVVHSKTILENFRLREINIRNKDQNHGTHVQSAFCNDSMQYNIRIKIVNYKEERSWWLTSVLTRNLISISLQDRIRCKTRIFLLPALPLPDITLTKKIMI